MLADLIKITFMVLPLAKDEDNPELEPSGRLESGDSPRWQEWVNFINQPVDQVANPQIRRVFLEDRKRGVVDSRSPIHPDVLLEKYTMWLLKDFGIWTVYKTPPSTDQKDHIDAILELTDEVAKQFGLEEHPFLAIDVTMTGSEKRQREKIKQIALGKPTTLNTIPQLGPMPKLAVYLPMEISQILADNRYTQPGIGRLPNRDESKRVILESIKANLEAYRAQAQSLPQPASCRKYTELFQKYIDLIETMGGESKKQIRQVS